MFCFQIHPNFPCTLGQQLVHSLHKSPSGAVLTISPPKAYSCYLLLLKKTESLDNAIRALIGLAIMVYEPSYHALQIWQPTHLLKIKRSWKWAVFTNKVGRNSQYLWAFLVKQRTLLAIYHLVFKAYSWGALSVILQPI